MFNPPHPGSILREDCLAPRGLAAAQAAELFNVAVKELSAALREETAISPYLALQIEKAGFGSARLWLGMQVGYDSWHKVQP